MWKREIWLDYRGGDRVVGPGLRVRGQLLAVIGVLLVLAELLPSPVQAGHDLGDPRGTGASTPDTAMLLVGAVAVWLLLAWVLVVAAVALLARVPGVAGSRARRLLRRIVPTVMRNALLAAVGASMLTGVAACGTAASAAPVGHLSSGTGVEGSTIQLRANSSVVVDIDWPTEQPATGQPAAAHQPVVQLPTPSTAKHFATVDLDWPSTAAKSRAPVSVDRPTTGPPRRPVDKTEVVVHRGDSLWAIAARRLPADADPAQIERAWHQWYSTNKAVIGDDPNLILPGQLLLPPNPGTGDRS